MPRATQLELGLANETGVLARLCRDLATGGVNLLAIAAPGGNERHADIVRLLVANRDLAVSALTRAGYSFSVDEVLFVELKNRPGALARAVEKSRAPTSTSAMPMRPLTAARRRPRP